MKKFASYQEINSAIRNLADKVNEIFCNAPEEKPLYLVVIAPDAVKFYAELCVSIKVPHITCIVQHTALHPVAPTFIGSKAKDLHDKHVLILAGSTLNGVTVKSVQDAINYEATPASMKVASLVFDSYNKDKVAIPDFALLDCAGKKVVGFGLNSQKDEHKSLLSLYYLEE